MVLVGWPGVYADFQRISLPIVATYMANGHLFWRDARPALANKTIATELGECPHADSASRDTLAEIAAIDAFVCANRALRRQRSNDPDVNLPITPDPRVRLRKGCDQVFEYKPKLSR